MTEAISITDLALNELIEKTHAGEEGETIIDQLKGFFETKSYFYGRRFDKMKIYSTEVVV